MNTIPVSQSLKKDRLPVLDFIRGLALLGILLINIQTYSLFAFFKPNQVYALGLDQPFTYAPLQFFIHTFVRGQFYTIYSFLFGLGFYLMWARNSQAGLPANHLFKRRLWSLLVIGLVHAFVFWFGDILHKYALLGFTLIYFNNKSVSVLLKWIVGLVLAGILLQIVLIAGFPATQAEIAHSEQQFNTVVMEVVNTWKHGTVGEVMNVQKLGVLMLNVMAVKSGMASYLHCEIMFLLGLTTGKLQLFYRLAEVKTQFLRTAFWVFPLGLLLKGIAGLSVIEVHLLPKSLVSYETLIISLADFVGSPLLTMVYLVELSLFFNRYPSRLTGWIANAGHLGLTNYLVQTLLCMGLFYGYGIGLCSRLTLLGSVGMAGVIYIFQVGYSTLWLKYYRQGPLEWMWRKLTYGKHLVKSPPSGQTVTY